MWDMGWDVEYGVKCETWENNRLINSIDSMVGFNGILDIG